jgi:hypothetical protein
VCDIWRSYWAQRLLWEMGASVLFVSGTVDQVRNAHDYVKDFRDEMQVGGRGCGASRAAGPGGCQLGGRMG